MAYFTVVLVRPMYPRNIGMCARAIANMGAARLVLIAPAVDFQSDEAKQGAAGAQDALRAAMTYSSLEDFYAHEGEGVRFAFSARVSKIRDAEKLGDTLVRLSATPSTFDTPIYLFFGPEDDGLTAEDMRLANHVCALPTFGSFTSLNLSHAVSLALYIFQDFYSRQSVQPQPANSPPTSDAQNAPIYYPEKTINTWLETLGFDLSAQKVNIAKTMHRLLLANQPSAEDLRLLESVLQQNIRKLRSK